ncbi:MAG TPA: DinB family protein, partial [Gemmatimonadales bacterium]
MQAAAQQGSFLLAQHAGWLADLEDQHLACEPIPGAKTAGWLLGHLVVTGDFARRLCGLGPIAPKAWRPLFAPGTSPSHDAGVYPPMRELLDHFRAV